MKIGHRNFEVHVEDLPVLSNSRVRIEVVVKAYRGDTQKAVIGEHDFHMSNTLKPL